MARLDPLPRQQLTPFEAAFRGLEQSMGFVPNSMLTMGRVPAILEGFIHLAQGALGSPNQPPLVSAELLRLVGYMTSHAAGCRYCQAHTASMAARLSDSAARVEAIWEFETSPLFSAAERAALRLALAAGTVPNTATDQHFADLRRYYSQEQIVQIMAVIALYGFLNRWNDTIATELEAEPNHFGREHLSDEGWHAGKHAP